LQGTQSKAGLIGVIASCEVDQPALQQLLYDLEAGMPYLFVEQLVVQAPVASAGGQEGRMRVLLAVYGQWQGGQ
jgi:general secretion pathway protein M